MGFFAKLLGTEKAVDAAADVVKTGVGMLDNAFFTDQEKQEGAKQAYQLWLKQQELIGQQSTPTAISRRIVAWGVLSLVWLAFLVCMGLVLLEASPDKMDQILDLVERMKVGWAFTGVIVFYFGTHLVASLPKSK